MKKQIIFLFSLFFIKCISAQENIFWDRSFWSPNTQLEVVKTKIEEGNNPATLTKHGFDAPIYAILGDAPDEVIIYLLKQKGNGVDKITHDGRTYLFWSAYQGNLPVSEYLLANGSKIDALDEKGNSILLFSTLKGHNNTKIYDLLLAHGASINESNPKGANVLLYSALGAKDFNEVSYFLKKGIPLNYTDKNGYNVVDYASKVGNRSLIEQLIKQGASYKDTNKDGSNAILLAAEGYRHKVNNLAFFEYLESLGIDPNITNNEGENPLHKLAYRCNDIKLLAHFVEKGVNPNSATNDGDIPLILASYNNDLKVVKFFAERTTNINIQNSEGESALTSSIYKNKPEVVSYLLQQGANPFVKDKKGNSLVYYLILSYSEKDKDNFEKKWELLSKKGLQFNEVQSGNNTLYHLAVEKNSVDLLQKISELSVDINAKNEEGLTALHKAVMTANNTELIKKLLSLGANPNIRTDFGETAYDLAKENELLDTNKIEFLNEK